MNLTKKVWYCPLILIGVFVIIASNCKKENGIPNALSQSVNSSGRVETKSTYASLRRGGDHAARVPKKDRELSEGVIDNRSNMPKNKMVGYNANTMRGLRSMKIMPEEDNDEKW